MRLIDADALPKQKFLEANGNGMYEYVDIVYERDIDNAQTIDVVPLEQYKSMENTCVKLQKSLADAAPVRHGRWYKNDQDKLLMRIRCSICNKAIYSENHFAYCPNCGARMDGDDDE